MHAPYPVCNPQAQVQELQDWLINDEDLRRVNGTRLLADVSRCAGILLQSMIY